MFGKKKGEAPPPPRRKGAELMSQVVVNLNAFAMLTHFFMTILQFCGGWGAGCLNSFPGTGKRNLK